MVKKLFKSDRFFMTLVLIVAIVGIFVMIAYDDDILSLRKEDTLIGQALNVKKSAVATPSSLTLEELASASTDATTKITALEERIDDLETKVTTLEGTIEDLTSGSSTSGSSGGNAAKPGESSYS